MILENVNVFGNKQIYCNLAILFLVCAVMESHGTFTDFVVLLKIQQMNANSRRVGILF